MKRKRKDQIRISRELSEYISKVDEAIGRRNLDRAAQLIGYKSFDNLANQYRMSRYGSVPPPQCHKKIMKARNLRESDGTDHESSINALVEKILTEGGFSEQIRISGLKKELQRKFSEAFVFLEKGDYDKAVALTGVDWHDAKSYLDGNGVNRGRAEELLKKAEEAGMKGNFKSLADEIVKKGKKHHDSYSSRMRW